MKKWLGAPILEGVSGAEIKVRGAWRNRKRGAEGWKGLKASRYSVSVYKDFSSISYKDNVCLIIAALYSCYME